MDKGKGRKYDRGEVKMKIPVYLKNNVKNYEEKDFAIMTICSQTGNDLLLCLLLIVSILLSDLRTTMLQQSL